MGLRFDDLIPEETDIVKEAIRRLPQREMQDRIFRFRRALNLSNNHNALEKSEWTKPEEIEQELSTAQYFDNMSTIPENLRARNRSS
ncbi:Cytochrome b-c1 complex subunit 7 [Irineochytrium annulatum]|nr:Cytochrome b-c1 complex subunit 7 [Irineochytrium annulatum]